MRSYGFDYHQHGMTDVAPQYVPRGSRLRWSGIVNVPFYPAGTSNAIASYLAQRGLTAENIDWQYETIGAFPEMGSLNYRALITFVTPIDWNTVDAFGVVTDSVSKALAQTPTEINGEVLLMPSSVTPTGTPVYPTVPDNTPKYTPPGSSGASTDILDQLSNSLGITKTTVAFAAVALTLLLVLKK